MSDPINVVVVLDTTPTAAFEAFVAQINNWWPVARFSVCGGKVAIDPRLDGQVTETDTDGTQHVWGHVTTWEPGRLLGISWYIGENSMPTDIAVVFAPTDDGRTGVTLTHTGWAALGKDGIAKRANYVRGWDAIFATAYADYAAKHCPKLESSE